MKAWQMTGTGQPLQRNEVPVPTVRPGTVLVTVKAAGLCHSDVSSRVRYRASMIARSVGSRSAVRAASSRSARIWGVQNRVI